MSLSIFSSVKEPFVFLSSELSLPFTEFSIRLLESNEGESEGEERNEKKQRGKINRLFFLHTLNPGLGTC